MKTQIFTYIFLLSGLIIQAQAAKLDATVNKTTVSTSESFKYTLTLNTDGDIRMNALADFDIIQGPSVSTSMQIINGAVSNEKAYTYFLRAKKQGSFTIPAATAKTPQGVIKSNTVKMTVVKGTVPQKKVNTNSDLISSIEVSKKKVFVGEPIVASYKVYTKYNSIDAEEIRYPESNGFWTEAIEMEQYWERENVNGVMFRSIITKRDILFPQQSGNYDLGSFGITARCRPGGFFSRPVRLDANSAPLKIEVVPLPKGKPANFVGTYKGLKLDSKVNKNELAAHDAINLEITLSGKGNMKLLNELKIDFPPDMDVFEAKIKDNISINPYGESGSRSFEYVIIPRSAGQYIIPSTSISYFDWSSKSYKSLSTDEFVIKVSKGNGDDTGSQSYSFDSKSDVNILNQDIRYIKASGRGLQAKNISFFLSPMYFILFLSPVLIFFLVFLFKAKKDREELDVSGTKKKRAGKAAKKHLSKAESVCDSSTQEFQEELFKAINGYLSDKFGIPQSELNKEQIKTTLSTTVDSSTIDELLDTLTHCEMARYAPVSSISNRDALEKVKVIINKIESGK